MNLEGIIICVGYSDFLAHTLPLNKHHFNRLVVVTDTKDTATKNLCEHLYVECIQTDVFYQNGDTLNKGAGINAGLQSLGKSEWVLHLDADIVLPPLFRTIMEKLPLNEKNIYGVDRMMCPNYEAWQKYVTNPVPTHEGWCYVHPTIFPMGVRICEYMEKGWEPLGFFQMWNPVGSRVLTYPDKHGAIDRTDVLHAKKFSRKHRHLIPEIIVIHLESENLNLQSMGKNWNGRKTKLFSIDTERMPLMNVPSTKRYRLSWFKRFILWIEHFFSRQFLRGTIK